MKNQKRENHNWSKKDFILTFFVSKYGTDGIFMKTDKDLSTFIGTSVNSFNKMCSNFRHLLGIPNQLNHIKNLQWEVYEGYNNKSYIEYLNEVRTIVNQDEMTRKIILERKGVKNYRFIGRREL